MADLSRTVNRVIPAGSVETPSIVIPVEYNHLKLRLTRDNWPAAGCTIGLGYSRDGGQTFTWLDTFIRPAVVTAKDPAIPDAVIEYAWNPDRPALRSTRVAARTNSPSSFISTVTIEAGVMLVPPVA